VGNNLVLVTADVLQRAGMTVEAKSSDRDILAERCTGREPVASGGWSDCLFRRPGMAKKRFPLLSLVALA
jgi:hypothetical protein